MGSHRWSVFVCFIVFLLSVLSMAQTSTAETKYFDWEVSLINFTRNCYTSPLLVVNGLYPGPTVYVNEGDHVIVKVRNSGPSNVTIHWHGIRQLRSCWQDGTGYITECPVQPGSFELYDFVVSGQSGTTFWHAHVGWIRASVHGAFITRPASGSYPFPQPDEEIPVVLGEWWNEDVVLVEAAGVASGTVFAPADALTLNGLPGTEYNCTETEGVTTFDVEPGKTYLLRVVNAALNSEFFFAIANHVLTVVEADSSYVKPFTVDKGIIIAPGQTVNALVTANQSPGTYYMVGKAHTSIIVTDPAVVPSTILPFLLINSAPISTNGFFQYKGAPLLDSNCTFYPDLPVVNDTEYSTYFANGLKTLYPENLPSSDHIRNLYYTVGLATEPCSTCIAPQEGYRLKAAVNNITFENPTTSILQAYYYKTPGVFTTNFPDFPPRPYDYTAAASPPDPGQVAEPGMRVAVLEYGTVVDLVLQDISNFAFEDHPFHLHGHFFYVLGQGSGNYDGTSDPAKFNYYDPPARFTVNVPARGWVAIRFLADNPGVWFFHCHLEDHLAWGMASVFIVKDGKHDSEKLLPPPKRLNPC